MRRQPSPARTHGKRILFPHQFSPKWDLCVAPHRMAWHLYTMSPSPASMRQIHKKARKCEHNRKKIHCKLVSPHAVVSFTYARWAAHFVWLLIYTQMRSHTKCARANRASLTTANVKQCKMCAPFNSLLMMVVYFAQQSANASALSLIFFIVVARRKCDVVMMLTMMQCKTIDPLGSYFLYLLPYIPYRMFHRVFFIIWKKINTGFDLFIGEVIGGTLQNTGAIAWYCI